MTKQAIIGIIVILGWMFAGVFNLISGSDMMIGLIGFMAGVWLTTWENKCVEQKDGE